MSLSDFKSLSGRCTRAALLTLLLFPLSSCMGNRTVGGQGIYVGVAGVASRLEPDTSASQVYSLDDSQGAGGSVIAGLDLSDRWSAETRFSVLGSAELDPQASVDYQAADASLLFYALADGDTIAYRQGFAGFLRGGATMMMHESDISLDAEDNFQFLAGVGFDYLFGSGLGIRAEVDFHDTDALAAHMGVLYRFGTQPRTGLPDSRPLPQERPQVVREPSSQPQPRPQPVPQPPVQPEPQPVPTPQPEIRQPQIQTPVQRPEIKPLPEITQLPETQVIQPQPQNVPAPVPQTPVVQSNLIVSGILEGVRFVPGTSQLQPGSGSVLSRLAGELIRQPSAVIELAAHTNGVPGSPAAMALSRQQVGVVGRLLISQGVPVRQVRARAFGANRTRPGMSSASGNERVELLVIQP